MPRVVEGAPQADISAEVVVIGAGACGLTAALAAHHAGREVLVLEQDASPAGSTSLSSGFVPAGGTRFQALQGIEDSPETFLADILAKSHGTSDPRLARLAVETIPEAMAFLADHGGAEWQVIDDFLYPAHSRHRMHAVPERTGAALEARLLAAAGQAGIPIVTEARAEILHREGDRIAAVTVERPGGAETVGTGALVLACNGYGGNRALVEAHIPQIADGVFFGHAGNTGHAIAWGEALGAALQDLTGYQGHGSVAHPHGILISWGLMMEGGVQVNTEGRRFADETGGYSEAAVHVLAQPGGVAWCVYDAARHAFAARSFPDYREAMAAGAIREAASAEALAAETGLPPEALAETLAEVAALAAGSGTDRFGRDFTGKPPLAPPYHAVRVTGALFHTQGGLVIGPDARVLRPGGQPFPNLHAAGGAACGVSGPGVAGYLSGNGLLTAIAFGYLAGRHAGT